MNTNKRHRTRSGFAAVLSAGFSLFGCVGTNGNVLEPKADEGSHVATQLAATERFACARMEDGKVRCWGEHAFDAVLGGPGEYPIHNSRPVVVPGLENVSQIVMHQNMLCAILQDRTVSCIGNFDARLPQPIRGLHDVTQFVIGMGHGDLDYVALTSDGTVLRGPHDPTLPAEPTPIAGLGNVRQLAGNDSTFCAVRADGALLCWGSNGYGQLGDGTVDDRAEPQLVEGLTDVAEVAVGSGHVCARLTAGTVRCWGGVRENTACTADSPCPEARPVDVPGVTNAARLSLGGNACARLTDGTVQCWGSNLYGALGTPPSPECAYPATSDEIPADGCHMGPTAVVGLTSVVDIAVGSFSTCASREDGSVVCWGRDSTMTTQTASSTPTPIVF